MKRFGIQVPNGVVVSSRGEIQKAIRQNFPDNEEVISLPRHSGSAIFE